MSSITCFSLLTALSKLTLIYYTLIKTFGKTGNAKTLLQYLVQLLSKKIQFLFRFRYKMLLYIIRMSHLLLPWKHKQKSKQLYAFVQLSNIFFVNYKQKPIQTTEKIVTILCNNERKRPITIVII